MTTSVRDAMTNGPQGVESSTPVVEAAKLLKQLDVGSLPTLVENGRRSAWSPTATSSLVSSRKGKMSDRRRSARSHRQIVTVDPQQNLDEALRLMAQHQVRRLPVVEEDGRLVGILAQADVAHEGEDSKTGQLVERISN